MNIFGLITLLILLVLSFGAKVFFEKLYEKSNYFILIIILSIAGYILTDKLIPSVKLMTQSKGLFGKDLNKKGTPQGEIPVPESLGIVPSTVFLLIACLSLLYTKRNDEDQLFTHCAGSFSICFIVFLGFCDDVLDLKWRYKLVIPPFASLPLLMAYSGTSTIVMPIQLRFITGQFLYLGPLYYVYMGLLAVFCTNSINIYAGINGLEVVQSLIIALSILIHNFIEMFINDDFSLVSRHLISTLIIIPYIFCTLALFKYNKYPSQVFVGDTFCYFSGMTFAVCGILGNFSKTLLLFFIPQIINFLYSLPQLIGIVPCPRHRLPKYNEKTKMLENVPNHFTLINLYLKIFGPHTEDKTCQNLAILQIISCGLAFYVRYYVGKYFF